MFDPHHIPHFILFAAYTATAADLLHEGESVHGRCALTAALAYAAMVLLG